MNAKEVKKPEGWRLFIYRVILVLFPVIILASVEGILRIAGAGKEIPLFEEDPDNQEYLLMHNRIAERYFIDPAAAPGVRYPSFRKEKPENGLRIVVQGASTVAGIPFKKGGAFPAMLEHRIQKAFPEKEVEVVNTGITAVCSYTLLDLADEIVEIEPDAVFPDNLLIVEESKLASTNPADGASGRAVITFVPLSTIPLASISMYLLHSAGGIPSESLPLSNEVTA